MKRPKNKHCKSSVLRIEPKNSLKATNLNERNAVIFNMSLAA